MINSPDAIAMEFDRDDECAEIRDGDLAANAEFIYGCNDRNCDLSSSNSGDLPIQNGRIYSSKSSPFDSSPIEPDLDAPSAEYE